MLNKSPLKTFNRFCWILIFYTVLVIVWGAWVRISHSGDGCGNNWPLCDGAFIPVERDQKTWIEYLHRLTSGFYGIFVACLFIASIRTFPKKTAARQAALVTFILMIVEALLGAALVLKGLVGENATIFRLAVMTLHQVNSLMLTGSTVALAILSRPETNPQSLRVEWRRLFSNTLNWMVFMVIPATGAWAALANTLFPSLNLREGIAKDFASDVPWILRLRVVHPILALTVGISLIVWFFKNADREKSELSKASLRVAAVMSFAIIFGILTLLFLSPVWMKLVHLTLAQIVWISLVNYVIISLLSTKR